MLNFDLMDTVAGKQIYNEGILDNTRELLTDVLRERFGIAPEDVTHTICTIGQRDMLKELMMHAVRCRNIEEFKNVLAKEGFS